MYLLNTFWEPTGVKGRIDIFLISMDPLKMANQSLLINMYSSPHLIFMCNMKAGHKGPTKMSMPCSLALGKLLWRDIQGETSGE